MERRRTLRAAAALSALLAVPLRAKVVFTGYADFRATPQGHFSIDGPATSLSALGIGAGPIESRGMTIDALGLFATTSLSPETRLQMDVTYRDVGQNARTIRVQYAYIEHQAYGATLQGGKITLPFGWYNQNRFYGFQRASISAPLFQSAILGLPIADIGATAGRPFELGSLVVKADVYAVNGFGPVPGSTTSFRSASLPGGLTIANNVGPRDANHQVAVGARLDLSRKDAPDASLGASYYRGEWRPGGQSALFQMAGAHARGELAGFSALAEYLRLQTSGDQGAIAAYGGEDWHTDGFFAQVDYTRLKVSDRALTPWVRFEDYVSRGRASGPHETLWDAAGGVAWQASDNVLVKAEVQDIYYRIPYVGLGDVQLKGYQTQLGLTVTF